MLGYGGLRRNIGTNIELSCPSSVLGSKHAELGRQNPASGTLTQVGTPGSPQVKVCSKSFLA